MSNSKTWKNRKKELEQKEKLLLDGLIMNGSKAKKIALWSLGTGVVALLGYGIYKTFTPPSTNKLNPKKKEKYVSKNSPIVDSAIENLAPPLGRWLLNQLKD